MQDTIEKKGEPVTKKERMIIYLILGLCLLLVCLPRFNRKDMGFVKYFASGGKPSWSLEYLSDAKQYMFYVEYFRGKDVSGLLVAPFCYRPFVPFMASFLPFNPMTSINIVNILFLGLAVVFLNLLLLLFRFSFRSRLIGSLLFIFSFPTFYYGAIGYIEPVVICFLTLLTLLILKKKWFWVTLFLIISPTVKESLVIIIPIAFVSLLHCPCSWKEKAGLFLLLSSAFFFPYYLVKHYNPITGSFFWWPSLEFFFVNVKRLNNWFAVLLGFSLQGFLALYAPFLFNRTSPEMKARLLTLFTGLIFAILLYVYSIFSAIADGRFVWTTYPFSIPLAVFALENIFPSPGCEFKSRKDP